MSELEAAQLRTDIARDLRLDACRGIALWFVFLDHIPNNICSWLTMSHYGFSDTSEVFMFVSGVTCALAYGAVQRQYGWQVAVGHTLQRSWQIYVAFLMLIIAIVVVVYCRGDSALADLTNTRVVLEHAGAALAHAVILQYSPMNTDVLPTFVLFHLFFAPLLWLLIRAPHGTLAASFALYALVQLFGWNLPHWPTGGWYFNPLAWQFLVVLGAWWVIRGRKRLRWLLVSPAVVAVAIVYLLLALFVTLGWSIQPLGDAVPQFIANLIYPIDKSDLDPLRLLHFLAIAVLVARFVPEGWPGLANPILRSAIRCGESSLEVYCVSILMSLVGYILLKQTAGSIISQIAVSIAGVVTLVAFAAWLIRIRVGVRQHPSLF